MYVLPEATAESVKLFAVGLPTTAKGPAAVAARSTW